jgi:hypothetical protein
MHGAEFGLVGGHVSKDIVGYGINGNPMHGILEGAFADRTLVVKAGVIQIRDYSPVLSAFSGDSIEFCVVISAGHAKETGASAPYPFRRCCLRL